MDDYDIFNEEEFPPIKKIKNIKDGLTKSK
jgi:hypothetical protein